MRDITFAKKLISLTSALCISACAAGYPLNGSLHTASALTVGDVDSDGISDKNDLSALERFLLGEDIKLTDADLCRDNSIDVFDLVMLRQKLSAQKTDISPVVINEVCASNKNSYTDKEGNSPDWAELFNNSSDTVDISGYGLSDGNKNRFKFTFPDGTVIPPQSYILVLCDDSASSSDKEFHAGFKISAGETVYLTAPDGEDADMLTVPESEADISYGRFGDGSDNFVYMTPTPNKTNDNAEQAYVIENPTFSHDAGFYDKSFRLELSSPKGYSILYTLDGSDPRTSDTAAEYKNAIEIYDNTADKNRFISRIVLDGIENSPAAEDVDKGFAVRAVCMDKNGDFGRVVTNSYFVGKTASFYKDMKVVSMSIDEKDLFDDEKGIFVYDNMWGRGKEWERPANVQVFENGKAEYSENIGVRLAGNSSRDCMQKSLTLFARSEYGKGKMKYEWIDGLKDINGDKIKEFEKITLRNSSDDWNSLKIRDTLLQKLADGRNISVQGQEFCTLFINGEFWGLYTINEKFDENYISSHYLVDKDDCTFYEIWNTVRGSEELYNEYSEFFEWAKTADMTKDENYRKVCSVLDIQCMADYIAFQTYICNNDWMSDGNGNISNNWAMWRSDSVIEDIPYNDGKWRFMVYDTERAASLYNMESTRYDFDLLGNMDRTGLYLNISNVFYNLMNNDDFRSFFRENYIDMINNEFAPERVDGIITKMSELTRKAAEKTNLCFSNAQANEEYDEQLEMLREFFEKRPDYAKKYLDKLTEQYK